jgi:hydroxymethylglutaryl-CoA lyase
VGPGPRRQEVLGRKEAIVLFPEKVEIVDVTLRDGLQSLEAVYATEVKLQILQKLVEVGLKRIEVTSFVRPDVVPQLADAEAVVRALPLCDGCRFRALVANRRGIERAAVAGIDEVVALITASETYNLKNQNMSIDRNLEVIDEISEVARGEGVHVVVAVGMTMYCPYEGDIPTERVLGIVSSLRKSGIDEYYIATSAGLDGPRHVYELSRILIAEHPSLKLGIHLHNTNGMGLANALAALQAGVRTFEGALCGIGGGIRFPKGSGNHGNLALEDLVNMFDEAGVGTGIDLEALLRASRDVGEMLGVPVSSYATAGGCKAEARQAAKNSPWVARAK